jgi:hypothetical protein
VKTQSNAQSMHRISTVHKECGEMQDVLVNGDLWLNNILLKKVNDNQIGDDIVAIVDWQVNNSMVMLDKYK